MSICEPQHIFVAACSLSGCLLLSRDAHTSHTHNNNHTLKLTLPLSLLSIYLQTTFILCTHLHSHPQRTQNTLAHKHQQPFGDEEGGGEKTKPPPTHHHHLIPTHTHTLHRHTHQDTMRNASKSVGGGGESLDYAVSTNTMQRGRRRREGEKKLG